MTLKTSFIVGGLFAATMVPALAADADTTTVQQTTVASHSEATGLLWEDGQVPFVLERFLKDGGLQA